MVTVCAWCQRYMGSKEPLSDPAVSHGICPPCRERHAMADSPVLVVSRARAATIPLLQALLRGAPDVTIVVDRRSGERRNDGRPNGNGEGHHRHPRTASDRRLSERRRSAALYVV